MEISRIHEVFSFPVSLKKKPAGSNSFEINKVDAKMMAVSAGGTGFLFKAGKQVEERGKNGSSCFRSFLCITVPAFNSTAQTNAGAGLKRFLCSLNTGGS